MSFSVCIPVIRIYMMNSFFILPDWAPNIHPMLVHFPIGLLIIAVLMDLLQLIKPLQSRLDFTAVLIYGIGTIGSVAAFWSGRIASETVKVSIEAQTVMNDHDDWALYTMIFFLIFTAIRIGLYIFRKDQLFVSRIVVPLFALIGAGLLVQTGELGKELVYKHGVGIADIETDEEEIAFGEESSRLEERENGWLWHAGENAEAVFQNYFEVIGEQTDRITMETGQDEEGYYLEIRADDVVSPIFLIYEELVGDISLEATIQADELEGRIGLLHHFLADDEFEFMDYDGENLRIGRYDEGDNKILDDGSWSSQEWVSLRVMADGRHYYAYADEETIAHGHGSEWTSGYTGLMIVGEGVIKLRKLHLVRLREAEEEDEL